MLESKPSLKPLPKIMKGSPLELKETLGNGQSNLSGES